LDDAAFEDAAFDGEAFDGAERAAVALAFFATAFVVGFFDAIDVLHLGRPLPTLAQGDQNTGRLDLLRSAGA
jgi:hypothetical protein